MEEQIFCDGIGRITVIGGVVRLDLFTYSPTETDANGNPRPVLSHRIVMGTDGFLRSSEKVVEAVQAISRNRAQPQQPQQQPQPQGAQWSPHATQSAPPPPQPAPQPAPQPPSQPAAKTSEPPPPARPPFP
jgi:hypothetical protein